MTFDIHLAHFDTEEEAVAQLDELGMTAVALDFGAETSAMHWHDFDSRVYVVDGNLHIDYDDGRSCDLHHGDMIEAPARVVHREVTQGYRAVIGFSVDPTTLSMPINKPAAELA
ncbi:MAG: cupin domain-containing protein [Acidimicrobiales bacterium]